MELTPCIVAIITYIITYRCREDPELPGPSPFYRRLISAWRLGVQQQQQPVMSDQEIGAAQRQAHGSLDEMLVTHQQEFMDWHLDQQPGVRGGSSRSGGRQRMSSARARARSLEQYWRDRLGVIVEARRGDLAGTSADTQARDQGSEVPAGSENQQGFQIVVLKTRKVSWAACCGYIPAGTMFSIPWGNYGTIPTCPCLSCTWYFLHTSSSYIFYEVQLCWVTLVRPRAL